MTARGMLVVTMWVAFVLSGLFALDALMMGLTFGFTLWDVSNPKPTILWLGVLAAPCIIVMALKRREPSTASLAIALLVACALDAAWIVPALSG